jgi:hypothetical protein
MIRKEVKSCPKEVSHLTIPAFNSLLFFSVTNTNDERNALF